MPLYPACHGPALFIEREAGDPESQARCLRPWMAHLKWAMTIGMKSPNSDALLVIPAKAGIQLEEA
jgi:hypothetical protein